MICTQLRFACVLCLLALIAPALRAQDAESDPDAASLDEPAAQSNLSLTIEGGASTILEADIDGRDGNVSVWRADAGATIAYQASDQWRFTLDLGSGLHWYDFDGDLGLGAGDIMQDARTHDLRLTAIHIIDQTWSVIAGATINAGYEDGADFGDALTFGGFGGAGYRVNDRLSLQFGAAVRSQLEDNALVLPYLGIQYQLSGTTALRSKGLGLELSMDINEQLTASIFAQYRADAFRLADDNDVLPAGVLDDRMVIIGASATWQPNSQFSLSATIGATLWRELEFRNNNGDDIGDLETDTSPIISMRASFDF